MACATDPGDVKMMIILTAVVFFVWKFVTGLRLHHLFLFLFSFVLFYIW